MTSAALVAAALAATLFARFDSPPPARSAPAQAVPAPRVRVPAYRNASCPIMGKPVSHRLAVDTEHGRIWLCCKACIAPVRADPAAAHRMAYPVEVEVERERCPVTGKPLGAGSVRVVLQGRAFRVADEAAAAAARAASQRTLALLLEPSLIDVANPECPIDDAPVGPDAFVVVDDRLIRLSQEAHASEVERAPDAALRRALASAERRAR